MPLGIFLVDALGRFGENRPHQCQSTMAIRGIVMIYLSDAVTVGAIVTVIVGLVLMFLDYFDFKQRFPR